jgi:heat shock protein HtpX
MKRIGLFLLTNIAVMVVISIVTHALGVNHWLGAHGINYPMLLAFSAVVGFAGSFISLAISKWMAIHAYSIHVIDRPTNQTEVWLVEKVREQAGRAGIPMPTVGIYESAEANAFATGPSKRSALVAVSSGLIRNMHQREVEGVLAHEVAHIANGDMVTMTLLQGVMNTFVVFFSRIIGFAIDSFLRRGDDERESHGPGIGFMLGMIISEIFLGLLASLVVMAYSRRREFAADAMAARIEGRDAMVGALRRLQSIYDPASVSDNRSQALAAFKISNKYGNLFSSHPPLEKRIEALMAAR